MLDTSIYSLSTLARNWWALLLRGAFAILFGMIAWFWPGLALNTLILLFAAYALAGGLLGIVAAVRSIDANLRWLPLLIEGVISIGAGLVALVWPDLAARTFLYVIAIWAILSGMLEIAAAVRLRKEISNEWLLGLSGVAGIVFGVVAIARPLSGALAVLWLIGLASILIGALLMALGWRLRGLRPALESGSRRHSRAGEEGERSGPMSVTDFTTSARGAAAPSTSVAPPSQERPSRFQSPDHMTVDQFRTGEIAGESRQEEPALSTEGEGEGDALAAQAAPNEAQPTDRGLATTFDAVEQPEVLDDESEQDLFASEPLEGDAELPEVDSEFDRIVGEAETVDVSPFELKPQDTGASDRAGAAAAVEEFGETGVSGDIDEDEPVAAGDELDAGNTDTASGQALEPIDVPDAHGHEDEIRDHVEPPAMDEASDETDLSLSQSTVFESDEDASLEEHERDDDASAGDDAVADGAMASPVNAEHALAQAGEDEQVPGIAPSAGARTELDPVVESEAATSYQSGSSAMDTPVAETVNDIGPESSSEEAQPARRGQDATGLSRPERELEELLASLPPEGSGWRRGDGTQSMPSGFPIKGNASSRIYHMPGGRSYEATVPEIWFAQPDDARSAGFRPRSGDPEHLDRSHLHDSQPFDEPAMDEAEQPVDVAGTTSEEPEAAISDNESRFTDVRKGSAEPAALSADEDATARPARLTIEEQRLARLIASLPEEGTGWVRGDGSATCPPMYSIKGNASSRIYHVVGGQSYVDTVAEICFATPEDAAAAGFRPRKGDPAFVSAESEHADQVTAPETVHASVNPAVAAVLERLPAEGVGWVRGDETANCADGYPVKGNADSMLYHTPDRGSYARTIPEFCFATEEDAERAGFRAAGTR